MKTNKKFFVMVVASLLMATSVWAAGTVTVVKKLNGTVNAAAGTVESSIAQTNNVCTLTVTPASGNYVTVENITAERIIDAGKAQAPRRAPEMSNMITVTAETPTADPSGVTTYTFDMPASQDYDVEVTVDFQSRTSIETATITLAQTSYTFTGEACEPAVSSVVLNNSTTLTTADYSVSYENNIGAGTATVKVTGLRTYTGEATTTFTINKATLSELSVSIVGWTYGAEANTPEVDGNLGEGDVTFTYKAKDAETFSVTVPTNAGDYVVKAAVAETDNYAAGEATAEFTISKAELTNASVSLTGWTYGDDANTPSVTGNLGNGAVTYTYANVEAPSMNYTSDVPTAAGNYSVKATIAATDNYLGTEVTNTFSIAQADLALVTIDAIADQDWTGEAIEPAVVVRFNGNVVSTDEYSVTYENNINPGTATVTLTTKNVNFSAAEVSPSQTFNILGTELSMNGHEWITYLATEDMVIPTGLKVYVIASVTGRNVMAEETTYIPKDVAVLINAVEAQDQYIATPYRGEDLSYQSMLQGATTAVDVTTLTAENDIFVLYNNEFVKTTSGTIPAGRCYLPLAKGQASSRLSITLDDEETTAVGRVNGESVATDGAIYTLNGLRVEKPTKGLYIVNGKKVVIK